jgi:FKBP-type peptidyl-prolyl cis-trans isomerase FklB
MSTITQAFQSSRPLHLAAVAVLALSALVARAEQPPAPAAGASESSASVPALASEKDRISYAVGVQTGRALRSADGAEVNLDALVRGIKDGLDGEKLQIPQRQIQELLGKFQQTLRQKMAASRGRAIADNRVAAEKFLADNKTQSGVVALDSGVQYRIIKIGTGPKATESDTVTVNYRGTLLNGNEFDATEPGRPAHLNVSALIAGWKQVLKLMPVGSHWQVYIPPQLGYGERGVGADIGPNELLIFDLELLGTQPSAADR